MIDLSKIKPGDEVLLRFVVSSADSEDCWPHVEIDPRGQLDGGISTESYLSAGPATIVSHTPKALAVGDRVVNIHCATHRSENKGGEVLAIVDGWAMVRFWERAPGCVRLSDLERVS